MRIIRMMISFSVIGALFIFAIGAYAVQLKANDFEGNEQYWTSYCSGVISDATKRQQCIDYQSYLENKIASNNNTSSSIQSKIDTLNADLSNLKELSLSIAKEIEAQEAEIKVVSDSLVEIETNIAQVQADIDVKVENIEKRSDQIKTRMVEMQTKVNTNQFLDYVMGASDLVDLVQRANNVESFTKNDKDQIALLNEEKQQLEEVKAEKKRQEDLLVAQQKNLEIKKAELELNKKANDELVESTEVRVAELLKARNEANAAANTLALLKPNFSISGGNANVGDLPNSGLIAPIQGSWISRGVDNNGHRGIDYAATMGTPIVAPADCYVVFASNSYPNWGGLGNWAGIPAGGGNSVRIIFSVNGETFAINFHHMTNNVPAMAYNGTGQPVPRGTVLGYVGSSGNSSGPHAHVEMFKLNQTLQAAIATWYNTGDWQSSCGWGLYTPAYGSYGSRVNPAAYF